MAMEAAPPPNVASAAAADAAASSLGVSLGLSDPSLDEGKQEGQSITALQVSLGRGTKRPKVTHSLFFEDDKGLKKILKTFPAIKFRGKGSEYEDLSLLLAHYKKWFQELYPYGDHFEDLVLKSRQVLEDKEKDDDGTVSDPRERLHAFRFQYKNASGTPAASTTADITDEARARIEANRKAALERKKQKEAQKSGDAAPATAPAEQDVDFDDLWQQEQARQVPATQSQGGAFAAFEEEDPFDFGGGFDDFAASSSAKPVSQAPASAFDEDDVFGFGCEFDDAPAPKAKQPEPKTTGAEAPPAKVDPEVARRIAENRAKALERKKAASAAVASAAAPQAVSKDADGSAATFQHVGKAGDGTAPEVQPPTDEMPAEIDEDPFDFGCSGFDDP